MPRPKTSTNTDSLANVTRPPLPNGWKWVRFGEVVNNVNETVKNPLAAGLDRFVGLEHLEPRDLRIRSWGNVTEGTTFNRVFRAGHVLFGKRRAYQRKAALADFDGVCSGDIYVFAANELHLVPELLPFLVQSEGFAKHAEDTSEGSLSPRTKWKYLAEYVFALRSDLGEQRRIAELLRAADEAVEAWREVADRLEDMAEAIIEECVERRFCISKGSVPLGDNSDVAYGLTVDKRRDAHELSQPYLRVANVQRGFFDLSEVKAIGCDQADIVTYSLKPNDVLVVEGHADPTEIGRAALWKSQVENCLHQNHIIRVRPSVSVSPAFLLLLLNSERGKRYFRQHAKSTSGLYTINSTVVKRFPIPKADRPLQEMVVAEISKVMTRLGEVKSRMDTAQKIRILLLHSMLTQPEVP